ncbi:signal transduction histidine kinase [Caulobacter ginsengisoli]|uniref:histidine kinase n=1 Tax=Caulobacter ginsengisoli TaxID=400775 RepID=A0ABU0ILE5_9CAUL|nr:ATP-binding protein [Caulobacter ginsengisoli]MDQ0462831.1 signal transduction histidine kinase [Caulobacter ginsengisoli]
MPEDRQSIERVLRWRFQTATNRVLQVVLIYVLATITTGTVWPALWMGATLLTMFLDACLSRWALADLEDPRRMPLVYAGFAITSVVFSSVALVFLSNPTLLGVSEALLITGAIVLNTALMARGARTASLILAGPSALLLLGMPFLAPLFGHTVGLRDALPMAVGGAFYVGVLVKITRTLSAESDALRSALADRKAAMHEIEQARDAAQAANQAKSSFLATMSHEIRTPLNGVLGMAQAMAREPLSEAQRQRLDVIGQSGETLLAILNDILDLSKIEAGKLELEVADFNLEAVAHGAHAAFTAMANAKGLSFNLVIAPAARGVYRGDSVRVRQVLYNLISNAVKFTDSGHVQVAIDRTTSGVRMVVSDTGLGLDPNGIARLFDKFVQADSSTTRRFGGTGLGLAICAELCHAMGGTIQAESLQDQGSAFTVELPLERVAEAASAPGLEVCPPPPSLEERDIRVLAAEDNPVNQMVLKTLLAQLGIWPVIVDNGQAAVEAWEAGDWDAILMDVQMPVMDGPTATRAIRAKEAASGRRPVPIIALTANAMTHQVESYRAAGMTDFVAKPIRVAELLTALAAALEPAQPQALAS